MRESYVPDSLKLIFICESPPASDEYFYNENGKPTEPLCRATIQDVFGFEAPSKGEGLARFHSAGFILVDATYRLVNEGL